MKQAVSWLSTIRSAYPRRHSSAIVATRRSVVLYTSSPNRSMPKWRPCRPGS
ncbi:hypothetical protein HD595_005365 [Nonomuraea roseoviolacea subsp. carminata]|uniref:Uncharacterized protein n=1 Tax=Nonomuraea roseoviolacea subsp. carminata TaxID=160689 RepID=A0ABT1K5H2_9ACTN|nr:hypothetical protein [Nonomuraea roseoviolacea subsp. carminata]